MIVNSIFRSRILIICVLAAFVLLITPVAEFAQGKAAAPAATGPWSASSMTRT